MASNKRSNFLSYRCINTLQSENTSSKIAVPVFFVIIYITYYVRTYYFTSGSLFFVEGHRENVKGDSRSIP